MDNQNRKKRSRFFSLLFFPLFLIFFYGCFPSASDSLNSKVSLDDSYSGPAKIDGAFPAVNKLMAQKHLLNGDFYYSQLSDGGQITHRVTIINPRSELVSLVWYLDGVAVANSNSLTMVVSPSLFGNISSLVGAHYLEVKLYDEEGLLLDKKKWIIDFLNDEDEFSLLTTSGESPADGVTHTYSKATDPEITFSLAITDGDAEGYYYKWYFDDEVINDPGINGSLTPSWLMVTQRYSVGQHTLTLRIKNVAYDTLLKEVYWGINITD